VWASDRYLLGDVPAAGGPHQHRAGDAHRIHERLDIGGAIHKGVSRRGLISAAVTALVQRHGMDSARQQRQQPVEGTPRLTPRVQQHNRHRGGRTGRDIGNGHPGCQANVADARLLVHSSTLARTGSGRTDLKELTPVVGMPGRLHAHGLVAAGPVRRTDGLIFAAGA